jgi:hypothetical protein
MKVTSPFLEYSGYLTIPGVSGYLTIPGVFRLPHHSSCIEDTSQFLVFSGYLILPGVFRLSNNAWFISRYLNIPSTF